MRQHKLLLFVLTIGILLVLLPVSYVQAQSITTVTPAPALVTSDSSTVSSNPDQISHIHLKAWIDGSDYIYIQGYSAWFVHRFFELPGYWGQSTPLATYINGEAWNPVWSKNYSGFIFDEFQGLESSDCYISPIRLLPSRNVTLSIEKVAGDIIQVVQQPSKDNDYTAIILFNDDDLSEAHWYEADITYIQPANPGSISFENITYQADGKTGDARIRLVRTEGSDGAVSASFSMVNGTAVAGLDYVPFNGTVTFDDNETVRDVDITLMSRNLSATNISFSLALYNVSGGASIGSSNVTTIIISYPETPTPAPISNAQVPVLPLSGSGNNSSGLIKYPSTEKAATTLAAVTTGFFLALLWPWLGKLADFLLGGFKAYLQGQYSTVEKKLRKTAAVERVPFLFGLSSQEILVGILSAVLLGAAIAYAKGQLFILRSFVLLIFIAGFTAVIHEIAHRYFAYRYKTSTEYKFWDVGVITLIVTALLSQPFASPARTIINDVGNLDKKKQGVIFLVGPIASILLSIGFLLLILYGNGLDSIGKDGFKLSMMACVYQLMPFNPLEGIKVFSWSKWAWAIVFLPALLAYLGMLLFVL